MKTRKKLIALYQHTQNSKSIRSIIEITHVKFIAFSLCNPISCSWTNITRAFDRLYREYLNNVTVDVNNILIKYFTKEIAG